MGCCVSPCLTSPSIKSLGSKFISYNVLDNKYKLCLGIYYDISVGTKNISASRAVHNTQSVISQGLCIGCRHKAIRKIKFGIIRRFTGPEGSPCVELYFAHNTRLVITREIPSLRTLDPNITHIHPTPKFKFCLTSDDISVGGYIKPDIVKQYKRIARDSEYLDLVYDLIHC